MRHAVRDGSELQYMECRHDVTSQRIADIRETRDDIALVGYMIVCGRLRQSSYMEESCVCARGSAGCMPGRIGSEAEPVAGE